MKKLLGLLLLFIFSFSLVGCFNIYEDKSKRDMELVDVKIYDKDNNEIKGTYKNFFGDRSPKNKNENLDKLNSAAPVFNYYVINASLNESYTIKFSLNMTHYDKFMAFSSTFCLFHNITSFSFLLFFLFNSLYLFKCNSLNIIQYI